MPTQRSQYDASPTAAADKSSPNGVSTEASDRFSPDASGPNTQRQWTPEPDPYDSDAYTIWGRKHFGEDWYQQRSKMLNERNIYIESDPVYLDRQLALRKMEQQLQAGKLRPKGKTWDELRIWSLAHYGPAWYQHGETYDRLKAELVETSDADRQEKIKLRMRQHEQLQCDIQLTTDAELLAAGWAWGEIMAFPPPARPERDSPVYRSPSPSSGLHPQDPHPPPYVCRALEGPDKRSGEWDREEWRAMSASERDSRRGVTSRMHYETILQEKPLEVRSDYEDSEGRGRRDEELRYLEKIRWLPDSGQASQEYHRRKRHLDRLWAGWSQERIDADDRSDWRGRRHHTETHEYVRALEEHRKRAPRDQEDMNRKFRQWTLQGFSLEEQEQLGCLHGFPDRPRVLPQPPKSTPYVRVFDPRFVRLMPQRPRPRDEGVMDRFLFLWNLLLSDMELVELARMYGFDADRRPDGVWTSRAQSSPPPQTVWARSRRVIKTAPAPAPALKKTPGSRGAKLDNKADDADQLLRRQRSPRRVAKTSSQPSGRASVRQPVVLRSGRLSKAPERLV